MGELIPGRVRELQNEKWLTLDALTAAGHDSPVYNEKKRAGIFYAESWALTHMLYLSTEYHDGFGKLFAALAAGETAGDAFRKVYGKSSAKVYTDLRAYLTGGRLFGALFDVKLTRSEETPDVGTPDGFESALVSADLLAAVGRLDRAQAAYEALAARHPANSEVFHSLGYLFWRKGDTAAAVASFEKAFDAGSKDPQMCYHLALLERQKGRIKERTIPALLRALRERADYVEARLELGLSEIEVEDYPAALAALTRIVRVEPEIAPRLFNAMAYAWLQTGHPDEARRNIDLARQWDRTDADKLRTGQLANYLDSRGQPDSVRSAVSGPPPPLPAPEQLPPSARTSRVEGAAISLNCAGDKVSLTIGVKGKPMTFAMPDPSLVQLKHNGEATFDFTCGPQKPFPLAVEYLPAATPDPALAGTLTLLEF